MKHFDWINTVEAQPLTEKSLRQGLKRTIKREEEKMNSFPVIHEILHHTEYNLIQKGLDNGLSFGEARIFALKELAKERTRRGRGGKREKINRKTKSF